MADNYDNDHFQEYQQNPYNGAKNAATATVATAGVFVAYARSPEHRGNLVTYPIAFGSFTLALVFAACTVLSIRNARSGLENEVNKPDKK